MACIRCGAPADTEWRHRPVCASCVVEIVRHQVELATPLDNAPTIETFVEHQRGGMSMLAHAQEHGTKKMIGAVPLAKAVQRFAASVGARFSHPTDVFGKAGSCSPLCTTLF